MIDLVKYWIILKVKRMFHYSGFIVNRIPDASHFMGEFDDEPLEVEKYELKKLASNIRIANNQKLYNEILKKYVSTWDDNFTSSEFIGNGRGVHNLCIYRKVCFEGIYYFEKVYFSDSFPLKKIEWFYEHVYPILKDHMNIAKLFKVIKGYLVTIVYFEFIEFGPLPKEAWYSVFFSISKNMFKLSKEIEKLGEKAPNFITDYRVHEWYKSCVKVAEKRIEKLSNNRLTAKGIEEKIHLEPLMFTHGDIHGTNVLSGNYIIDWDTFGFYPHGFESAFIFANSVKPPTFTCLQDILIKEYEDFVHKDQWEGFELCFLYFYLLFIIKDEESATSVKLQKDVYNRIDTLYFQGVQTV